MHHSTTDHSSASSGPAEARPSVSLNEALHAALPPGSRQVAGPQPPPRRVTWATAFQGRVFSLTSLEPGELVILPPGAASLLRGERGLARLVHELAEVGVSALAVYQPPSAELVQAAETAGLPLIQLAGALPAAEIERSVVELLVDREQHLRRRVGAVYERLLAALLEEDGAAAIAREVAVATGKAALVFDPYLQLLGAGGPDAATVVAACRAALAALGNEQRRSALRPFRVATQEFPPGVGVMVRPLELRGTPAGFLCLVGAEPDFGELDDLVVERAASVLAIEVAKQRAVAEARLRLHSDFLDELLEGPVGDAEAVAARAESLGYDLHRRHAVFVLEVVATPRSGVVARLRDRFVDVARGELLRSEASALVRARDGRVDVLYPLSATAPPDPRRLVEALRARLSEACDRLPVAAGVGRPAAGAADFPRAYREAAMALEVCRALYGGNTTVRFEDLGVNRLLFQLLDNPELEAYRRDIIGPLEDYDARHGTDLARTLEVFLASNGNHMQAARDLHLHRNTLLYRLQRVEELLGVDLDQADARLAVQVALKIRAIPDTARLLAVRKGGAAQG